MTKKTLMIALSALVVLSLCLYVGATLVYHQDTYPPVRDEQTARFWTSGTGHVVLYNNDTLAAGGSVTSIDIPLTINLESYPFDLPGVTKARSVASEIYFIGDYCKPTTYPTPCVDSVTMTYYYVDENGLDMVLGGTDTLVFDTTGLVSATAETLASDTILGGRIPFIFKLGATEREGNAFIGDKMRFKLTIIDKAPADDTLLTNNCGILRRWTN